MFQFGQHTYDPATGEIEGPHGAARLQPKPARLLAMLLEARGELVEREEIRAALWPDTNVDFGAGLNTCVRQIRTALGDTGGEAAWIETLPKRGYRVAATVHAAGGGAVRGTGGAAVQAARGVEPGSPAAHAIGAGLTREVAPYIATLLLLALGVTAVLWNELFVAAVPGSSLTGSPGDAAAADGADPDAGAPLRLAMLPFVDPERDDPGTLNRSLTQSYLTALVAAAPRQLVVIGPATTTALQRQEATLQQVATAVEADFVLHGGRRDSDSIFFVEVVHPDGAHLFARRFELAADGPAEPPDGMIADMTAAILEARSP